jgi:hypothetical protein
MLLLCSLLTNPGFSVSSVAALLCRWVLLPVASLVLVFGCEHAVVDDWPTYEVRGTVRSSDGTPVPSVLVELESYEAVGCGAGDAFALSRAMTDANGRYRTHQDTFSGILSGCLRLIAHPDSSTLSQSAAVVDLPVDSVEVIEGETAFTVDLTVP